MHITPIPLLANIAICTILKRDNKILLVKGTNSHKRTNDDAIYYKFVGGKCDEGENILECAAREAYEEVGVHISLEDLHFVHVMQRVMPGKELKKDWILFFFIVEKWQGELYNKEPNKHNEIAWWELNNLPQSLGETFKQALSEWQKNNPFSIFYEKE